MQTYGMVPPTVDSPRSAGRLRRRLTTIGLVLGSRSGAVSALIILLFVLVAAFAPLLATHDPAHMTFKRNLPPAWVQRAYQPGNPEFLLGTDIAGRDVASRLIFGARTALVVALLAAPLAAFIGTALGLVAGYAGGRTESALMRFTDIFAAFPAFMFSIAVVLILRAQPIGQALDGMLVLVIAYAFIGWVGLARLVRGAVLAQKHELYVEAAEQIGASQRRIVLRHILPNVMSLVVVWTMTAIARVIILEAFLGYVGVEITRSNVGLQFATMSWGGLFYDGRTVIHSNPIVMAAPAVCVLLVAVSFTLLGDRLRDVLDPQLRGVL